MLIAKVFLPIATPGLVMVGMGIVGVATSTYTGIEVIAIVLGLLVVAVAGVFTIRSNVAKIWREQAEGEKARNLDLAAQLADALRNHGAEVAKMKVDWAAEVGECLRETANEREAKERVTADLEAANARTDMTPVMHALEQILEAVKQ